MSSIVRTLKRFIYRNFFKLFYKTCYLIFAQNEISVVFSNSSKSYKNIPLIYEALNKDKSLKIRINKIYEKGCFFYNLYKFAKSQIIIVDQNNKYLSQIILGKRTSCIQTWHAGGVYKKVAYGALRPGFDQDKEIRRVKRIHGNTKYLIISDEKLALEYSSLFLIPKMRVLPLGIPRTDLLLNRAKDKDIELFEQKFPQIKGKKVVLYAPTFRTDINKRVIPCLLDIELLVNNLKEDFVFLYRRHPTVTEKISDKWIDVSDTDYELILSVSDILITDYSSILFDFSLFNKPTILFVPDLNEYVTTNRELMYPPNELVGVSNVCYETNEVIYKLKNNQFENTGPVIRQKFMSSCEGHSTENFIKFIKTIITN